MTTVAQLTSQTRQVLLGGQPEIRNTLATAISDTTTTSLVLNYDLAGITANSRVSIDLEDFHVYNTNPTTKTLTVTRGDYGSTAAASHAADSVVLCGTLFTNNAILVAFNDTLDDLEGRGLYAIGIEELTYDSAIDGYDLASITGLLGVISVESKATSRTDWHRLDTDEWRVQQSAETDDFASGNALILVGSGVAFDGTQLRVWCRKEFTALTALTDAGTASGLEDSAEDLLVLGAATRLAAALPMARNSLATQPDVRRAGEVPPGALLAAPTRLRRQYEQRVTDELKRLDQRYPVRLRVT